MVLADTAARVGAPLASFGDVGNKPRSLGAACAGLASTPQAAYLARLSQRVAATALRRELYADRTATMIRVSLAFGVRGARSAIASRRTTARTPRWSSARTRRHRSSGGDASVPSADASVAITGGRDGSALGAARGVDDGDDSLESRLRRASGAPCARQSLDDGANPSRFAGPHTAPLLSGYDASVPSAGMAATIVIGRNSFTMRAERGTKGDDAQWLQLAPSPTV